MVRAGRAWRTPGPRIDRFPPPSARSWSSQPTGPRPARG